MLHESTAHVFPTGIHDRFSPMPPTPALPPMMPSVEVTVAPDAIEVTPISDAIEFACSWCEGRARAYRRTVQKSIGRIPAIIVHCILLTPILGIRACAFFAKLISSIVIDRLVVFGMIYRYVLEIKRVGPIDASPPPREFVRRVWRILRPHTTTGTFIVRVILIWMILSHLHTYRPHVWDPMIVGDECQKFLTGTNQCGRFYGEYACIRGGEGQPPLVFNTPQIAWNSSTTVSLGEYVDECGLVFVRARSKSVMVYNITGTTRDTVRLDGASSFCIQHLLEGKNGWSCHPHSPTST